MFNLSSFVCRRTPLTVQAQSTALLHSRHVATRPTSAYPGHVPLSWPEKTFMAIGSGAMALMRPQRGDMVAVFGETTAGPSLSYMLDRMLESDEGRRILKNRPRINSSTIDMAALSQLPEGTFGHTYVAWLQRCGVTPDTREPVRYVDDPELAFVMQRYRECHDFYHAINGMPVSVEYEIAIKLFEFANLGLPMTALAGFAATRLSPKKRSRLFSEYIPWALRCGSSARSLITVYWEERWEQNTEDLKRELSIWDPPPPKWKTKATGTVEGTKGQESSVQV